MRKAIPLLWLLGCSSAPPAAVPAEGGITLSLSNATVREAAMAISAATREPFVVAPSAELFAECVRLTLIVPEPRPVTDVVALLDAPLSAEGFALTRSPGGWRLTHEGAPPPSCSLEAAAAVLARGAPAPTPVRPPPPPTGPVTETTTDIPRADVERWWESQDELARSARVIPHEEDGAVVGLRVFGIRPGTPMSRLGFQNGDTVYSVNGHSLASPDAALEAYSALRGASEYRVDLSRRGERIAHVIRVVE